jgi:hypothetical protein
MDLIFDAGSILLTVRCWTYILTLRSAQQEAAEKMTKSASSFWVPRNDNLSVSL